MNDVLTGSMSSDWPEQAEQTENRESEQSL